MKFAAHKNSHSVEALVLKCAIVTSSNGAVEQGFSVPLQSVPMARYETDLNKESCRDALWGGVGEYPREDNGGYRRATDEKEFRQSPMTRWFLHDTTGNLKGLRIASALSSVVFQKLGALGFGLTSVEG